MAVPLPLSSLLSQCLVAFTIECDNEFEHRMPHRTSDHGGTGGPWLTSLAMWATGLAWIGPDGVTVAELTRFARTGTNLAGLLRWGYLTVEPGPGARRSGALRSDARRSDARRFEPKRPGPDAVVRLTAAGRRAEETWRTLPALVEQRWRDRFGPAEVDRLRIALVGLAGQFELDLPDYLPILGYGLGQPVPAPAPVSVVDPELPLSALLSRVLLALALDFEAAAKLSLAIHADLIRVLDPVGVRVRDLPARSGVSKEAIAMATGIVVKAGLAVVEPDPAASRGKVLRLTDQGLRAQAGYPKLLARVEDRWRVAYGSELIDAIRASLATLIEGPLGLWAGLQPYPDGWRAPIGRPLTLPHFPMVLHRGGYPDGS